MVWILLTSAAWAASTHCEPLDMMAAMAEALPHLQQQRPAQAEAVLERARASLACSDQFLLPETLAELYQLSGKVAFDLGDIAGAQELWAQSVAVAPNQPFPKRFGSSGLNPYARVRTEVSAGPKGTVQAKRDLRLDGRTLEACSQIEVLPGMHLAQWEVGGLIRTELTQVEAGGSVEVGGIGRCLPPEDLARATPSVDFPTNSATPRIRKRPAWLLGGAALLLGAGGYGIYRGWSSSFAWGSWDEQHSSFGGDTADTEAAANKQRSILFTAGGAVALGLGGGLLGVGIVGLDAHSPPTPVLLGRF